MAKEAEFLPPELAIGALCVKLSAAEDLEQLGDVEQVLFQHRRVHQTIVHMYERAPAQRICGPQNPAVDRREALSCCGMRWASWPVVRKVETDD